MMPSNSLSECNLQLNRALATRNFSAAQFWLEEYRRQFDQAIQGLTPTEVLRLLAPAIESIRSAQYATLAARSHIGTQLGDLTRGAPYRKTEARHAWELQG